MSRSVLGIRGSRWFRLGYALAATTCFLLAACSQGAPRFDLVTSVAFTPFPKDLPPTPALETDCNVLMQNIPVTREVDVHVLSFNEEYKNGRIHAALTKPLDFSTLIVNKAAGLNDRVFVRVPAGFVTDFTSIPSGAPQSIHRTFGRTSIPAIAHDFLYAVGVSDDKPARQMADTLLRRGMVDNNSGFMSRHVVYWAVRWKGGRSFGRSNELRFLDAALPMPSGPHAQKRLLTPDDHTLQMVKAEMTDKYFRICKTSETGDTSLTIH